MAQMTGGNKDQNWVRDTEMAVMQFLIVSKANEGQGVTRENLQQIFQRDVQMNYGDHLDHCLQLLTSTKHLKQEGNKYVPTDDGREDVQKLERVFMAVPQMVGGGRSSQGSTMTGAQGSGTSGDTRLGGATNPVMQTGAMGGPKTDTKTR